MQMTLAPILDVSKVREFAGNEALAEFFRRFPPLWSMSDESLRSLLGTTYYVRQGEEIVGLLSLTAFDSNCRKVDLGIAILPIKGRRALATQACELVAEYVFESLGYNKITCNVLDSRSDLVDLLSSHGFVIEGTLRDSCYWQGRHHNEIILSLLRKDYTERC